MIRQLVVWVFLWTTTTTTTTTTCQAASSSSGSGGIVLRLRMPDGSMERILVSEDAQHVSLREALAPVQATLLEKEKDNGNKTPQSALSVLRGTTKLDDSRTLSDLSLSNGCLLTLARPTEQNTKKKKQNQKQKTQRKRSDPFDPFPSLAKDAEYAAAARRTQTRRASSGSSSYADLAAQQEALHSVEPQKDGPIQRLYMCHSSASRFQANGATAPAKASGKNSKSAEAKNRIGLLLGNLQRERVDRGSKPKARTSLSSSTEEEKYCTAARVHAIWEPTAATSKSNAYDAAALLSSAVAARTKALKVAGWLGLQPVGWIFTYDDDRNEDADALPVHGRDVETAARLQIERMKPPGNNNNKVSGGGVGRDEGAKYVTVAMHATTGATEAFQLSDTSVQMVAEDMILLESSGNSNTGSNNGSGNSGRFVATFRPILVDGKETRELDSVLCLVNTAMLSHTGSFAGTGKSSVKKSGQLTNKTRKALLKALVEATESNGNSNVSLMEQLCDFHTLLALDDMLRPAETEALCETVRKWARGQKRGTGLPPKLQQTLRRILEQ